MSNELTAALLLEASEQARSLDRSSFEPLADLTRAEALQAEIAAARRARGEQPVGYKIGFTNRELWPVYGVHHPIWGPVWNTTLIDAADGQAQIAVARFAEPRLEPEIVVGLHSTPAAATPQAVLAATEWIAHGFEIVTSPYPSWRFSAAEAVAAQSLHGALIVGEKRPLSALGSDDPAAQLALLARCEVELHCDGRCVALGRGANVLDGSMHAIAHLLRELELRGRTIAPGSLITTGTLTDAQPLAAGQRWSTVFRGIDLPGLRLHT